MKRMRQVSLLTLLTSLGLIALLWGTQPPLLQAVAPQLTAQNQVENAWQLAQQVGEFEFSTDVDQTIYPAPRLSTIGQPPREEQLYLTGLVNQPEELLDLTLYLPRENPNNPNDGLQIRLEKGRTLGRTGQNGEWEVLEGDLSSLFAPGGDPLGFLAATKNVEDRGSETRTLPGFRSQEPVLSEVEGSGVRGESNEDSDSQITFTRYTFDFDGPQFGAYMRTEMEETLRRQGELPPGLNLEISEIYRQTEGHGEIWVDQTGLPLRLTAELTFPRLEKEGQQIKAAIKTDYFNYNRTKLAQATVSFTQSPGAWIIAHNPLPQTRREWQAAGGHLAAWLLIAGSLALAVSYMHTRRFYQITATAVIASMLFVPLLQAFQYTAFAKTQETRAQEQQTAQAQEEAKRELNDRLNVPTIDPHKQESGVRSQESVLPALPVLSKVEGSKVEGSEVEGSEVEGSGVRTQGVRPNPGEIEADSPDFIRQPLNPNPPPLNPESRIPNSDSQTLTPESQLPAPILHLELDELNGSTTFADASPYGHNATCGTACPTAGNSGILGNALTFDGSKQYVEVAKTSTLDVTEATFSVWFKITDVSSHRVIFADEKLYNGTVVWSYRLFILANSGYPKFDFTVNNRSDFSMITVQQAVNDGNWHQATIVRTTDTVIFYLDGVEAGSISYSGTVDNILNNPLWIGLSPYNNGSYSYNGQIDRVIFFDQALTSLEVSQLYNASDIDLGLDDTDSDGDGLIDSEELKWGTCYTASACSGTSTLDYDGDGLSDGAEVNDLGTNPTEPDTDGDAITDTLEVNGFSYNGQTWYLDPLSPDTNKDGIIDGLECLNLSHLDGSSSNVTYCEDTDNDGTPDVWDRDDDDDGVSDAVDLSPQHSLGDATTPYGPDNPFRLQINQFESDNPLFVDLQLRPTNPDHLTHMYHIFDWPENDNQGQIRRVQDTTFYSTASGVQSNGDSATYGDMRLIPMLKIAIPYESGHYGNLPVLPNAPAITEDTELDAWLDYDKLTPYGITVSKESATSSDLTLHLPLNLIEDETGGGVAAFGARMLYWPSQATWGNTHEYELIWFVQLITDQCVDSDNDGDLSDEDQETCTREDVPNIIHVYDDTFTLTGLEVTEDHGLSVALIAEDPGNLNSDNTLNGHLWESVTNLGLTFMEGVDCADQLMGNTCTSDNQRDVTIATIGSYLSTWNTETTMLVETHTYPHQGYISQVMMTDTVTFLENHFSAYQTLYPTIAFAQEKTSRHLNLAGATTVGSTVVMDLDPGLVLPDVMASLNWAPYQYNATTSQWQNYTITDYWDYLGATLQADPDFNQESEAINNGLIKHTQLHYLSLYMGVTDLVEVDNIPIQPQLASPGLADIYQIGSAINTGVKAVSEKGIEYLIKLSPKLDNEFNRQTYLQEVNGNLTKQGNKKLTKLEKFASSNSGKVVKYGAMGLGLTLQGLALVVNDEETAHYLNLAGVILDSSYTLVTEGIGFAQTLIKAKNLAAQNGISKLSALSSVTKLTKTAKAIAVAGLIIDIGVSWGLFIYIISTSNLTTIQFNQQLAIAIASTIVAIILFAILFIPVIGLIITLLITIFDAIASVVCAALDASDDICNGIVGAITQFFADLIYPVEYFVNFDNPNRLAFDFSQVTYTNPEAGFTPANGVQYTLDITNTIMQYDYDKIGREATFAYTFEREEKDGHTSLSLGQMKDTWQIRYDNLSIGWGDLPFPSLYGTFQKQSPEISFADTGTGVNRNLSPLYINEAFVAPYEGCWLGFIDCTIESFGDTNHINLGTSLVFDILPLTLDGFVARTPLDNEYTLAWGQTGDLPFDRQLDADNDGLISKASGGSDPNDNAWDSDGDGLNDLFEYQQGTNPTEADSDNDGLTDREELIYRTNPWLTDSDADDLDDATEIEGWSIAYTDLNGDLQPTHTWSDPNLADADDDTLSDLDEYVFGFNPWTPTDAEAILNAMTYHDISLAEDEAPTALYPFENGSLSNVAQENYHAICQTTCPTPLESGAYGAAYIFDGGDYLTVAGDVVTLAKADFTLAAWVKTTATTQGIIVKTDDDTTWEAGEKAFYLNENGIPFFTANNNTYLRGLTPVNDGLWHHIAVVWDYSGSGTTGTGKIYVDGQDDTNSESDYADTSTDNTTDTVKLGRANYNVEAPNNFTGSLDEVLIVNRALSLAEITPLMRGTYPLNDLMVNPGQSLTYELTAQNNLTARPIAGVIDLDLPNDVWTTLPEPRLSLQFEDINSEDTIFKDELTNRGLATCRSPHCPLVGQSGLYANAVQFDGSDDYLTVDFPTQKLIEHTQDFNITAWVSLTSNQDMTIFTMQTEDGSQYPSVKYNATQNKFYYYDDVLGAKQHNATIALNTWYLISLDFKYGGGGFLYIYRYNHTTNKIELIHHNGNIDYALPLGNTSTLWPVSTVQLNLGATLENGLPTTPMAGLLDVVRLAYSKKDNFSNVESNPPYELLLPFNETEAVHPIPDTSLYNYLAICQETTCPTFGEAGYIGEGISLDGNDDIIDTEADILSLAKADFTIAAWVKTTATGVGIVAKNDDDTSWEAGEKVFYLNNNGIPTFVGHGNDFIHSTTPVNDGTWHHVAVVWDYSGSGTTGTGKIYVDGQDNTSSSGYWVNNADKDGDTIKIGEANYGEAPNKFSGSLDSVIIYDKALSLAQIQGVMTQNGPNLLLDTDLQAFDLTAAETETFNGIVQVNPLAETGHYALDLRADAAVIPPDDITSRFTHPQLSIPFEGLTEVYDTETYDPVDMGCNTGASPYIHTYARNAPCPDLAAGLNQGVGLDFNGNSEYTVLHNTMGMLQNPYYPYGDSTLTLNETAWTIATWVYPTHTDTTQKRSIFGFQGLDILNNLATFIVGSDYNRYNYTPGNSSTFSTYEYLDSSGKNYSAWCYINTYQNKKYCPDSPGQSDNEIYHEGYFSFDGVDDYLEIPEVSEHYLGGEITFGAWIKPNDNQGDILAFTDSTPETEISLVYDNGRFVIYQRNGASVSSNNTFPNGSAYHVSVSYNGSTWKLYVGGVEQASVTASNIPLQNGNLFVARDGKNSTHFKGIMDDIYVYYDAIEDEQEAKVLANLDNYYFIAAQSYPSLFVKGTNLGFGYADDDNWQEVDNIAANLTLNQWNHVAVTFQNTDYTIYANGQAVSNGNITQDNKPHIGNRIHMGWIGPDYDYFQGKLDYLSIYNQSLTAAEIAKLASTNGAISTEGALVVAPFDEIPGSTAFQNTTWEEELTCESTTTCPIAGVRGKTGQAIYFDGVDDYLLDTNWGTAEYGFQTGYQLDDLTIAMWIKGEGGTLLNFNADYAGSSLLKPDTVHFNNGFETAYFDNVARNEWQHLVLTRDSSTDQEKVYLNGVEIVSTDLTNYNATNTNAPIYIGNNATKNDPYKGYMDDLRVYDYTMSAAQVQALYHQSTPLLNLELDEETGASTITDSSSNGYVGTLAGGAEAGATGRIENSLYLDGESQVNLGTLNEIGQLTNSFSIMGWIKPESLNNIQRIIAHGRGNSVNGFDFGLTGKNLRFTTFGVNDYNTTGDPLARDAWQHVAMVMDASNDVSFYINGQLYQTIEFNQPGQANTDDPLYLGATTYQGNGNLFEENFEGRIDELRIFNHALTPNDIFNTYRTEYRWFRDSQLFDIVVDTTPPSLVELVSDNTARPNRYTTLQVNTRDDIAGVIRLQMGLKAPSASNYTWRYSPACQDSFGLAWCPAFDPTTLEGEGQYQAVFVATDKLGNVATSTVYTLNVDDTPPSITTPYSQTSLISNLADSNLWSLSLSGTISDPLLSGGIAGSGVLSTSLQVGLYDARGELAGLSLQPATLSGDTWQLDYHIPGAGPDGVYTVTVTAQDQAGNRITTQAGTVLLDTTPPTLSWDNQGVSTTTLTSTLTITGETFDMTTPPDPVLHLRFEEAAGATTYQDSSPSQLTATCVNCPDQTSGVIGHALTFNGVDDTLTIPNSPVLELITATLTAWVKPTWVAGSNGYNPAILALRDTSIGSYSWHIKDNYSAMDIWNGSYPRSVPINITPNTWTHLAIVQEGGHWTGYVNGVAVGSISQPFVSHTNLPLNIGSSNGSAERFTGDIDEVTIYNRALTPNQIYALAQNKVAGVSQVDLSLVPIQRATTRYNQALPSQTILALPFEEPPSDSGGNTTLTFADYSGNDHLAICSSETTCPRAGTSGVYGHALSFDGADDALTLSDEAAFDLNEMTVAAWIQVDQFDKTWQAIVTKGDSAWRLHRYHNTNTVAFGTSGLSNTDLAATSPVNDGEWHHVAGIFDGNTKYIYVDGVLEDSVSVSGAIQNNARPVKIGENAEATNRYFAGRIDQVTILDRALSQTELQAVMLQGQPLLHLDFETDFASDGAEITDKTPFQHPSDLISNDASNSLAVGQVGHTALSLDGVDDRVDIAATNQFDLTGDATLMLWVNPDDWYNNNHTPFMVKGGIDGTVEANYYFGKWADGDQELKLSYYNNSWVDVRDSSGATYTDGQWYHLTLVIDVSHNIVRFYRDGELLDIQYNDFSADPMLPNNHNLVLGQYVGSASANFAGDMDDVRIYPRVLSSTEIKAIAQAGWQPATLDSEANTWSYTLPADREGYYELYARAIDNNANVSSPNILWRGMLDTQAPEVIFSADLTNNPPVYTYTISDFNLTQSGLVHPCTAADLSQTTFDSLWYRAIAGETSPPGSRLVQLDGNCANSGTVIFDTVTACDLYGHCTTQVATEPIVRSQEPVLSNVEGSGVRSQGIEANASNTSLPGGGTEGGLADSLTRREAILADNLPPTVTIDTLVLTRTHYHPNSKLDLQGRASDNTGLFNVTLIITGGNKTITLPTTLTSVSQTLNPESQILNPVVWTALWYLGTDQPDGLTYTVTAIATDLNGQSAQTTAPVVVDVRTPQAMSLTVTYTQSTNPPPPPLVRLANTGQPVQAGDTIRLVNPSLTLTWTQSSDGSGLAPYVVAWQTTDTITGNGLITVPITQPRASTLDSTDGLRLDPQVAAVDTYGNTRWESFGPIYIDQPLTPDYTALDYDGWLNSDCTLIGVDRRVNQHTSDYRILHAEQRMYLTWDEEAVRLAWTGANWETDGDLFIYLDTIPNVGSRTAYDPYASTYSQTTIFLSGVTPFDSLPARTSAPPPVNPRTDYRREIERLTQQKPLQANYAVWVQDSQTVTLLGWDEQTGWATVTDTEVLTHPLEYKFRPDYNGGQTDLRLPFPAIGLTDPAHLELAMVAFATQNDALKLWSVLPNTNYLNDPLVVDRATFADETYAFALNHYYLWPNMQSLICPNGIIESAPNPDASAYYDADLTFEMTLAPEGTAYNLYEDNLFWLWDILLGAGPDQAGGPPPAPGQNPPPAEGRDNQATALADLRLGLMDVDHARLGDGEVVTYTIGYHNQGVEATNPLTIEASTFFALRLTGGTYLPDEERERLVLDLASIPPGETGTLTFTGYVDLTQAQTSYQTCLAQNPDAPAHVCDSYLNLAAVDVVVFDESRSQSGHPLEWFWAEHQVDHTAPAFFNLTTPADFVALRQTTFQGYAFDPSGVASLDLQFNLPGQAPAVITCTDISPSDGSWRCVIDVTALPGATSLPDGSAITLALRATDPHGNQSEWQPAGTLTLDTTPATTSLSLNGQTLADGGSALVKTADYTLFGLSSDNHDIGTVEICTTTYCQTTAVDTNHPTYRYNDIPASPLALESNTTCQSPLVRTFTVAESFTVAEVALGLNLTHPVRDDLALQLIAPSGQTLDLIVGEQNDYNHTQNYNLWLQDDIPTHLASEDSHALAASLYQNLARPDNALATFQGEAAQGTWQLTLCDAIPTADDGWYNQATLQLTPANYGDVSGGWRYPVSTNQTADSVSHAVSLTPIDRVGNRGETMAVSVVVDNVAPVISITGILTPFAQVVLSDTVEIVRLEDKTPIRFNTPTTSLNGQVSDGGTLQHLNVLVKNPAGDLRTHTLPATQGDWAYTLLATAGGRYQIWVQAVDEAGNATLVGPYDFIRQVALTDLTITRATEDYFPTKAFTPDPQESAFTVTLGTSATLQAQVAPATATIPIVYQWQVSDHLNRLDQTGQVSTQVYTWTLPGPKTIIITATNAVNTVTGTYTLTVVAPTLSATTLYLPLVMK